MINSIAIDPEKHLPKLRAIIMEFMGWESESTFHEQFPNKEMIIIWGND